MLVALPQPYDFDLSTARFHVYGRDRANLWHDGGLHRVIGGREVRIEAAQGGVDVTPHDAAIPSSVFCRSTRLQSGAAAVFAVC